jgi:hypothetical protein
MVSWRVVAGGRAGSLYRETRRGRSVGVVFGEGGRRSGQGKEKNVAGHGVQGRHHTHPPPPAPAASSPGFRLEAGTNGVKMGGGGREAFPPSGSLSHAVIPGGGQVGW